MHLTRWKLFINLTQHAIRIFHFLSPILICHSKTIALLCRYLIAAYQ